MVRALLLFTLYIYWVTLMKFLPLLFMVLWRKSILYRHYVFAPEMVQAAAFLRLNHFRRQRKNAGALGARQHERHKIVVHGPISAYGYLAIN